MTYPPLTQPRKNLIFEEFGFRTTGLEKKRQPRSQIWSYKWGILVTYMPPLQNALFPVNYVKTKYFCVCTCSNIFCFHCIPHCRDLKKKKKYEEWQRHRNPRTSEIKGFPFLIPSKPSPPPPTLEISDLWRFWVLNHRAGEKRQPRSLIWSYKCKSQVFAGFHDYNILTKRSP